VALVLNGFTPDLLLQLSGAVHNLAGTPPYQLTPVWGSNVFVGVVANDARRTTVCSSCTRQVTVSRRSLQESLEVHKHNGHFSRIRTHLDFIA